MKHLLLILLFFPLISLSQKKELKEVRAEVDRINKSTLDSTIYLWEDLEKYFEHGFDGGAEIIAYRDSTGLRKFKYTIGCSFGRVSLIMYFTNGEVISITEIEENFKLDCPENELEEVFRFNIYITDASKGETISTYLGKRKMSSKRIQVSDYEEDRDFVLGVISRE